MFLKVIQDDGFVMTLLRPCRQSPIQVGKSVDVIVLKEGTDLNKMFERIMDDDVLMEVVKRMKSDEVLSKSKTNK